MSEHSYEVYLDHGATDDSPDEWDDEYSHDDEDGDA